MPTAIVIVTAESSPVLAAMKAAPTVPIVFAALGDAIRTGATTNLAYPDRNATGMSFLNTELDAKRFGVLYELLPGARLIAVLFDCKTVEVDPSLITSGKSMTVFGARPPLPDAPQRSGDRSDSRRSASAVGASQDAPKPPFAPGSADLGDGGDSNLPAHGSRPRRLRWPAEFALIGGDWLRRSFCSHRSGIVRRIALLPSATLFE
jgi:hypothetical protein